MSEQVELELKLKGGDNAVKTLGQLEQELDKARQAIKEVEVGSDAFNKLATQIQNASSEVKTLEKQMEGLEPQQKAEAFLKMGEGIAGGFAVAQGAMGLMGVESENLEKIQVKVQSAIAIAQGIRMMSEAALMVTTAKRVAIEKLSLLQTKGMVLWTTAMSAATAGAAVVQKLFTGAVATTSGAFRILKIAIMSTGIGALVVAIGAMVVGITSWIASTKEQSATQKELNDALLKENEAILYNLELKREKDKADSEEAVRLIELRESRKAQTKIIENNNAVIKKNNELMEEGVSSGLQEKLKTENERRTAGNKIVAERINLLYKETDAVQATIDAEKKADDEQKKVDDNKKSRSSGRRERRKKEAEELLTLEQELSLMLIEDEDLREQAKIEQDRQKDLVKAEEAKNSKEQILLINQKYDILEKERQEKHDQEVKARQDEKDKKELDAIEQQNKAKKDLNDGFAQNYYTFIKESGKSERELAKLQVKKKYQELAQHTDRSEEETKIFHRMFKEEMQAIDDEFDRINTDKKIDMMHQVADAFSANIDARKTELDNQLNRELAVEGLTNKQKEEINKKYQKKKDKLAKRQKAIQASQSMINTFVGATRAVSDLGPIAGPVAASAIVLGGLASVRQIYAQDVGDGGGGGGGGSTPPSLQPSSSGEFTLGGAQEQQPMKAFVVESEITDSQAQMADINRRSTI